MTVREVAVVRLGQRLAATLQADGTDRIVWDDEIRGFGLRARPSGQKRWIFQYRPRGEGTTKRLTIGDAVVMKAEEARTVAKAHALARARGEDPAKERDAAKADLTVAQLIERWVEAGYPRAKPGRIGGAFLKPSSAEIYQSGLRHHVVPLVGKVKLAKLSRVDVERMQRRIARGETAQDPVNSGRSRGRVAISGGEGIAGRVTAYFAAVLTWGVREGLLAQSPAEKVHVIPAKRRNRHLSWEEVEKLGEALAAAEAEGISQRFTQAIRLIALTGCRKTEVLALKWRDVDLQGQRLRLPDSKTGAKVVPLTTAARAFLEALPREIDKENRPSPWVFPAAHGDGHAVGITKVFDRVRKLAGFGDDVTLHVLRHSFATLAIAAGGSLYLVGKALGHSNAATTECYAHVALDPVHAVVEPAGLKVSAALAAGAATWLGQADPASGQPRKQRRSEPPEDRPSFRKRGTRGTRGTWGTPTGTT
ncbi:MAG TPA: tyrosine-type recombinase/integrase [Geminicoccus sp.]|uniref:tyrosine-type recombinase/integrase n=1 Tax=Geminicoccus sp. TaxID=2024832 RepID=UPI002C53531C|nr:tyrosine-type recombinase/integrase [Geminicoccus sp.]HWL69005.1 tyrosine-type recombinase/integrase [Geminicoccus sp.]